MCVVHPVAVRGVGDLIEMFDGGYDGLTCSCGGAWFTVQAVALDQDAKVTAWAAPLTCRSCGLVRVDGAWVKPDLQGVLDV